MKQALPLKASYGIDAPGVVRNLLIATLAALLLVVFFPAFINIGPVKVETHGLIWVSVSCGFGAIWMLIYSLYGKYIHRDRMLSLVPWTGNEQALDVGTGGGLLLIGIAKRLNTGKATGIDIWNAEDLTANCVENVFRNAKIEGVTGLISVLNENATQMSFENELFDVVFTNECLHNIAKADDRLKACQEILRVLKPGGVAVISDHAYLKSYQLFFEKSGCHVKMVNPYHLAVYPPLRILRVSKPLD
jgi:SAM-dependent methyltransferase